MITKLLPLLPLIPLLGFMVSLCIPRQRERPIFSVAIAAVGLELAAFSAVIYHWLTTSLSPIFASAGSLYTSQFYDFGLSFYFDGLTAVFMGMTLLLTILIMIFSKFYMHREPGFKRFYNTILLFVAGLSLVILAGNFEVLFIGWELIGISSVLLIAFYRDRVLPARNALKVFSLYRAADMGILAALWYAHHIFEKNINFTELHGLVAAHHGSLLLLGLMLFAAAIIKSAQFPFSYWLPRAMEGPTTSSAIFYGALSVHMGLFLMLRTYPLWQDEVWLRVIIAAVGLLTALVASSITHVQSSIKTQIAYASVTQIGIMFIELALGLHWLVLLHFVSNASLRTYQLLISPSVVSYLVHDQFFYFVTPQHKINSSIMGRLRATLYVLGLKEWNMNSGANYYFWRPLKAVGRTFAALDTYPAQLAVVGLFAALAGVTYVSAFSLPARLSVATMMAIVSIAFYVRAFATKNSARVCWNLIMFGHICTSTFLAFASEGAINLQLVYGAGVMAAYIVGSICLWYIEDKDRLGSLRDFQGSIYVLPLVGQLFFAICLVFMAFPITPSFLAQDILLSQIPEQHAPLIAFFCFSYLLSGVSVMRLYIKTFFGPHSSSHSENAYKAS